jgi:hypothetical protein
MNPWKNFSSRFGALMEEEKRIVPNGAPQDHCSAYVTFGDCGEFSGEPQSFATERLQAEFELLATEVGIALGSPAGTSPTMYFLHHLFLELRTNKSSHVRIYSDTVGLIEGLFDASVIYCTRLDQRWRTRLWLDIAGRRE